MKPLLVVNNSTQEAYIVRDTEQFAKDYQVRFDNELYGVPGLALSTALKAHFIWSVYPVSDLSWPFIVKMGFLKHAYVLIGHIWCTERTYEQFNELQYLLDRIPKYSSNENTYIKNKVKAVKENVLALSIESAELLQELPHKDWRAIEKQPYNETKALEELIDMFFFVFNIGIAMDWKYSDLIIAMAYKMHKNFNRIKEGYNKTD